VRSRPTAFGSQRQEIVVPADQEKLTPQQLEEDIPKSLMAKNPSTASNMVCYSFADSSFKLIPSGGGDDNVVFHMIIEGSKLHKGTKNESLLVRWAVDCLSAFRE
jgi:hypothetical protein